MAKPQTVNLDIMRGDDFEQKFQLLTCDQENPTNYPEGLISGPTVIGGATFTPVDLTGCTILSQIRKTPAYAASLLATFAVTINDAQNGIFTITLTNTQTLQLGQDDNTINRYDVQVTDVGGKIKTYVAGVVNVPMDISRA